MKMIGSQKKNRSDLANLRVSRETLPRSGITVMLRDLNSSAAMATKPYIHKVPVEIWREILRCAVGPSLSDPDQDTLRAYDTLFLLPGDNPKKLIGVGVDLLIIRLEVEGEYVFLD